MRTHGRSLVALLSIWLGTLLSIFLSGSASAHVVEQLYVSVLAQADEKEGVRWRGEIFFDAGYALAEMRDDEEAVQPERDWLVGLSREEAQNVRVGAEAYLRECLSFQEEGKETVGGVVGFQVAFIDYESTPPDFLVLHNGGAYLRVQVEVWVPWDRFKEGGIQVRVAEGKRPHFVFNRETVVAEAKASGGLGPFYEVVKPGESLSLDSFMTGKKEGGNEESSSRRGGRFLGSFMSLLSLGWRHVVSWDGLDHLLLICALFLLRREGRSLLGQSLVFTLAHSVTLGLALAGSLGGVLSWLGPWVEALIALSIAVVALENLYLKRVGAGRLGTVFFFGLLHGLGFAGSLGASLGQSEHWVFALLIANVGIELAQVAVLASAWVLTMRWCESVAYERFRLGASLVIAGIGLFWMVERLF